MEIIFILIGLIAGSIFAFFVLKSKFKSKIDVAEERTRIFEEQNQNLSAELNAEREKVLELNSALSSLKADYNNLQKTLSEQKEETEKLQEKFAAEFENLANKILEEKSSKFTLQNKENLDQILKPLGEKIKEFEKKVNEVYVTDSKERASLATQLKNLQELNQIMAKEANNLTNALKGETKTMGNWGEFILESILEKSGLV
ncbi:MAG: DNA recombination protein RmuC, partial [Ignavibacteriaceae bacterium]